MNTALTNKTHGSYKQNTRFLQTKHTRLLQTKHTVLTNKTHGSYKQNTRFLQTKHTVLTNNTHGSYKQSTHGLTNKTPRSLPTLGHRSARPHVATAPKNKPANPKPRQQQQTGKRALCAHKQQQTVASYAGTPFTRRPAYRQTSGLRQASCISRHWMQHSLVR